MTRLPDPGSDSGQWGQILNDFLSVEHNPDGSQKTLAISKGGTGGTSIAEAQTNLNAEQTANKGQPGGYAPLDSGGAIPASYLPAASGSAAPIGAAGGDLGSSYPNPTVPALTNKVDTSDARLSDARTPAAHASTHAVGGSDPLTGLLDATARVQLKTSGTSRGTRRAVNFIAGSNTTITASDDSVNERVNLTIAAGATNGTVVTWLNVKDFGAMGDGITDDTVAINRACAAARTRGAATGSVYQVYLPGGTYNISNTINALDVYLRGDGRSTSKIQATTDWASSGSVNSSWAIDQQPSTAGAGKPATTAGTLGPTPSSGTILEDLWLNGPGTITAGQVPCKLSGIRVGGGASIVRCRVEGFFAGAYFSNGREQLYGPAELGKNYYGIYYGNPSTNGGFQFIENVDVRGSAWANVAIASGKSYHDAYFSSVRFGSTPFGFYKETTTSSDTLFSATSLVNCTFEDCSNGNIFVNGPSAPAAQVTNSSIIGCTTSGCLVSPLALSTTDANGWTIGRQNAPCDLGNALWYENFVIGANPFLPGVGITAYSSMIAATFKAGRYETAQSGIDRVNQDGKLLIGGSASGDSEIYAGSVLGRAYSNTDTASIVQGDVVETAASGVPGVKRSVGGHSIGVALHGGAQNKAIVVAHSGVASARCGSNNIAANALVKPDNSQTGCVTTATIGDSGIIGVALQASAGGSVTVLLQGL
jgi:hypothetical protein